MVSYKIMRFFSKDGKGPKLIKSGLTLEAAQAHCSLESTHKVGVWFDGYTKEDQS